VSVVFVFTYVDHTHLHATWFRDVLVRCPSKSSDNFRIVFRPNRVHEMQSAAASTSVARCVCQSFTCLSPAEMAERIEVLFGAETPVGPRNIV